MVRCPKCYGPLVAAVRGGEEVEFCRPCQRPVTLRVFPALDRLDVRLVRGETAIAGEAPCFNCPGKKAVGVCEDCGSYLCADCRTDWFGKSLCLNCIHANREIRQADGFRPRALLHDNIAVMLMVLPLITIPCYGIFLAVAVAPASLYLVIRHRKSSRGMVPRGSFRLWLGGAMAVLLLVAAAVTIGFLIWGFNEAVHGGIRSGSASAGRASS